MIKWHIAQGHQKKEAERKNRKKKKCFQFVTRNETLDYVSLLRTDPWLAHKKNKFAKKAPTIHLEQTKSKNANTNLNYKDKSQSFYQQQQNLLCISFFFNSVYINRQDLDRMLPPHFCLPYNKQAL